MNENATTEPKATWPPRGMDVVHTLRDMGDGSPLPKSRAERRAMTAAAVKSRDWRRLYTLKTAGTVYRVYSRPKDGRWHDTTTHLLENRQKT